MALGKRKTETGNLSKIKGNPKTKQPSSRQGQPIIQLRLHSLRELDQRPETTAKEQKLGRQVLESQGRRSQEKSRRANLTSIVP